MGMCRYRSTAAGDLERSSPQAHPLDEVQDPLQRTSSELAGVRGRKYSDLFVEVGKRVEDTYRTSIVRSRSEERADCPTNRGRPLTSRGAPCRFTQRTIAELRRR